MSNNKQVNKNVEYAYNKCYSKKKKRKEMLIYGGTFKNKPGEGPGI